VLGTRPKNLTPPNILAAKLLFIPNSPTISTHFCTQPSGEYIVEQIDNYKIIVKKPNTMGVKAKLTGCSNQKDFTIWVFEPNGSCWMPKHLETLQAFYNLNLAKRKKLFYAIKDVVLSYIEPIQSWNSHNCQNITVGGYSSLLVLSYLKWMAVLEDTRYPTPKYLGRKMAFAGYVLINSGLYAPNEIKRLLKIW